MPVSQMAGQLWCVHRRVTPGTEHPGTGPIHARRNTLSHENSEDRGPYAGQAAGKTATSEQTTVEPGRQNRATDSDDLSGFFKSFRRLNCNFPASMLKPMLRKRTLLLSHRCLTRDG